MNLIKDFEETFLRNDHPAFRIGDTVKVHLRIVVEEEAEANGNDKEKKKVSAKKDTKERIQVFTGTVISRNGSGLSETFTLYRNAYGSSMERVFLLNSPKIGKIEVIRSGKVRRAKLTYIRGRAGKAAKIREVMGVFHHETPEFVKDTAVVEASPIEETAVEKKEVKKAKKEQTPKNKSE